MPDYTETIEAGEFSDGSPDRRMGGERRELPSRGRHAAQLKLCHEHIGERPRGSIGTGWEWCALPAVAWCFDDELYVCDMHLIAKHDKHRTQPE